MFFRIALSLALMLLCAFTGKADAAPNLDYDLWANTPLAHLQQQGGIVADAGTAGFAKYLRDNLSRWKLGVQLDQRTVALPPNRRVRLWLPVGPEQAGKAMTLDAQLRPAGTQSLAVFVGGQQVANEKLSGRWQNLRFKVPAGVVKQGQVEIRLLFRRSRVLGKVKTPAAIRYVRLAREGTTVLPADEASLAMALNSRLGAAVRLPVGGGLDYYVTPVKGLRIKGTVAGGKVEVSARQDGKATVRLGGGSTLNISLDRLAGKAARLMFRARGGDALLLGARITGSQPRPLKLKAPPRRVVFWLIDTLRADKLSFYSRGAQTRPAVKTPTLSRLAAAGAVFEPFWVNSNESKAGHASFFTGTYPHVHRVVSHSARLKNRFHTLAEAFKGAGYRTAAFIGNGYISAHWNYMQGFDSAVNFIRQEKPSHARQIVDSALGWLKKNGDKPFYLYLGTNDPHVTYRAHKGFIKQYDPKPYGGPYRRYLAGKTLERMKIKRERVSKRNRQRIEALYENEIAYNDDQLGRLLRGLRKLGLEQDTLLIVTSDHGEEFWEHGSCGHGHSLYEELINVPLILHWPGVIPGGRVISGHDGTDLLATVQAVLGKPQHKQVQGESLLPFVRATTVYPRAMMATKELTMQALRIGNLKVILRGPDSLRVYDLGNDPGERKNLSSRRPVLAQAGMDPLSLFVTRARRWSKARWGVPNNLKPGFLKDN